MWFDRDMMLTAFTVFFIGLIDLPKICSFQQSQGFYLPALAVAKRGHGDGAEQTIFFKDSKFDTETEVDRYDDVTLECIVGGSPSPVIYWLKDDIRIQQGVSHEREDDEINTEIQQTPVGQPMLRLGKVKSKLYIDCVSDYDEAKYMCVAETENDKIVQTTVLKIRKSNDLPMNTRESCITKKAFRATILMESMDGSKTRWQLNTGGEPARIYLWTSLRLEFEGASVQLLCRSEGYPAPACSWRYGELGKRIENDHQYQLLKNGDLVVNNVNWMENMGDYFCRCENESGADEISTFLYPTEP